MIVSHKYKFIFIKTRKTGGTSLEIALSKFMGQDDIVTPITREDEKLRLSKGFVSKQNYRKRPRELEMRDLGKMLRRAGGKLRGKRAMSSGLWPMKFYNHIPAHLVRKRIGVEIWKRYYKFSIERNPWDASVSLYFWLNGNRPGKDHAEGFRRFVLTGAARGGSNYDLYSIDGVPALDFVARYESLEADLAKISRSVGLPENVYDTMQEIRAKSQYRKNRNYKDMYDDETKSAIAEGFAREIELFNYAF